MGATGEDLRRLTRSGFLPELVPRRRPDRLQHPGPSTSPQERGLGSDLEIVDLTVGRDQERRGLRRCDRARLVSQRGDRHRVLGHRSEAASATIWTVDRRER